MTTETIADLFEEEPVPCEPCKASLSRIANLKVKIKDLADELQAEQNAALAELEGKQRVRAEMLQSYRAQLTRQIDNCVKANVLENDIYRLVDKARKTRVVNVQKFARAYPEVFVQIAQVPVIKAEALVGKVQLEPLCEYQIGAPNWDLELKMAKKVKP